MKRNKIMEEARQLITPEIKQEVDLTEYLLDFLKNEPWYSKLYRWFELQKWILYCYIFNNKFIQKWKYLKHKLQ